MNERPTRSRRDFARDMMLGATGAWAGTSLAAAAPANDEAPSPGAVWLRVLLAYYPEKLTPELIAKLRERLERQAARSQALSAFPLSNGDEPALSFRAFRAPPAVGEAAPA